MNIVYVSSVRMILLWSSARPKGRAMAESGVGFLGGAASPLPPSSGSGERYKLPSEVWGGVPAAKRFCLDVLFHTSQLSLAIHLHVGAVGTTNDNSVVTA